MGAMEGSLIRPVCSWERCRGRLARRRRARGGVDAGADLRDEGNDGGRVRGAEEEHGEDGQDVFDGVGVSADDEPAVPEDERP